MPANSAWIFVLGTIGCAYAAAIDPSASSSSSIASASALPSQALANSSWFQPKPGDSFLWDLEGDIPASPISDTGLSVDASIYDVDLFNTPNATMAEYKQRGKKVVCYFSAGSWEEGRPDAGDFLPECYCNQQSECKMDGWQEYWLDLSTPSCVSNIQDIMTKRIALAMAKGCDAVEPDNTDSYINNPGWQTTIDDQYAYLQFLSETVHNASLGVALKNGPDMISNRPGIVNMTDFAIIEQCSAFDECDTYSPFIEAGKAAFEVEYETSIDCSKILKGFYALAYSSYNVDYRYITKICAN